MAKDAIPLFRPRNKGIAGAPILPTTYQNPGSSAHFLFVASSLAAGCDSYLDKTSVGAWDVTGAVMGELVGRAATPIGVFTSAVGGAATRSLTEVTYQGARYAWCRVRGGSSGPREIKTT